MFTKQNNLIKTAGTKMFLLFLFIYVPNSFSQENISCLRKISILNANEALVEIQINKNKVIGFGKIEELIPAGFKVKANEKSNGVFSFVDAKVKFLWMELPNASTFKVSYKLSGSNVNNVKLEGNFSYLVNEQSFKTIINTVSELPLSITSTNKITSYTSKTVDVKKEKKESTKVEKGTVYKVQIGAFKQSKWEHTFTNIKNLSSDKTADFTRYYSGSFKTLQDAEKHQKELLKKGYNSTFVVYFTNGIRHTINEEK